MMTSALLATSAVIVAPFAENDSPPLVPPPTASGVVAAGQHRPQRLGNARRLGVFQVDDEHVAAGPAWGVELLDQLPDPRKPAWIVCADQDAVRPGVRHHGHALLGIRGD